jgi:predicted MPP superfamily phosphohydrolase
MLRVLLFCVLSLVAILGAEALWPVLQRPRWRAVIISVALASVLAWTLPVLLGRGFTGTIPVIGQPLKILGSVWIVTAFLIVVFSGPLLLLRLLTEKIAARPARNADATPDSVNNGRRTFLRRVGTVVPGAAALAGMGGVMGAEVPFLIKRETVRLRHLPAGLDGFRIGQLTDVHVGAFVSPADVHRAVEALNEEHVDMQVMTGDLLDDLSAADETFEALGRCAAPHGLFAIYGNHEHWRGISQFRRRYRQLAESGHSVHLLVDESTRVVHNGVPVRVVGVDYPFGLTRSRDASMAESASLAFRDVSPDETVICLSHHPEFFSFASKRGARLTLSGHTHGGQVAIFGIPLFSFLARHILGRYRDGENHLYVSGGTGHWLPFRIGVPAEVTVLTLRAV